MSLDPAIEKLNLAEPAHSAAYALKAAHPNVEFTSGRRDKNSQASAMASNVVKNRKWIVETYKASPLCSRLQKWVDEHPAAKTQDAITVGLISVFDASSPDEVGKFSKHLAGLAFDVQPVTKNAEAIKTTIKGLKGLTQFLEKEGGLVRWHCAF